MSSEQIMHEYTEIDDLHKKLLDKKIKQLLTSYPIDGWYLQQYSSLSKIYTDFSSN